MVDLWNMTLTVKGIEHDGSDLDTTIHVMHKGPNPHFNSPYLLIDEQGNKYRMSFWSTEKIDDLVELRIEFEDQELALPPGTVLHVPRPDWIQEIPDSRVVGLEYETISALPALKGEEMCPEIYDWTKVLVRESGDVAILKQASKFNKHQKDAVFSVPQDRVRKLFEEMLRCVSKVDCYRAVWCDDTSRTITFQFENGEELKYNGSFIHNDVHTDSIMRSFVEKSDGIMAFVSL